MDSYNQTIQFLFSLQRMGIKLGLDNTLSLLDAVDNPHHKWPSIHIAGTNGKGSTAAVLESILLKAGYRVGLYTSPHLVDFTERIRVNRKVIGKADVVKFTNQLLSQINAIQPSFFEVTTAMAFWYFAQQKVDIAVVETGMGGRLDSTNVLTPLITMITHIDFDHQKYLGDTIEQIAAEKGGIIKSGIPCLTSNQNPTALTVLKEICQKKSSYLFKVFDNLTYEIYSSSIKGTEFHLNVDGRWRKNLFVNLPGDYQMENVLLAVGTIYHLKNKLSIDNSAIVEGLKSVSWKARLQLISKQPQVILDVSHNPQGFEKTFSVLRKFYPTEKISAITFLQEDKDFKKISAILASNTDTILIVDLQEGKPLNPETYLKTVKERGGNGKIVASFQEVRNIIHKSKQKDRLWIIIGSHYLAGEAYKHYFPETPSHN